MTNGNAELKDLREKVGSAETVLASLNTKAERILELVTLLDKLETRIRALEEKKGKLDEVVAYKEASDGRITSLEQTKWYYKGGLHTIYVIFLSSGVLGVILGIIISRGLFPP
jgi:hypothetical protein